jgi:hypothetical protein
VGHGLIEGLEAIEGVGPGFGRDTQVRVERSWATFRLRVVARADVGEVFAEERVGVEGRALGRVPPATAGTAAGRWLFGGPSR